MTTPRFSRRDQQELRRSPELGEVLPSEVGIQHERWLWVSPHDDDVPFGGGLWMQAARDAGVEQSGLVVSDGRMGYCSQAEKVRIVDQRVGEAQESYELLGLDASRLVFLGFPDAQLEHWTGRRRAFAGDPGVVEGYTGLQNAFTAHLRRVRPHRVLVPGAADLHPDHQAVHRELLISIFHACGDIWPELGIPLNDPPRILEMALYCDFERAPNLELQASEEALQCKVEAMRCFRSQRQSDAAAARLTADGPCEYLHQRDFPVYRPSTYRELFA